jgi:hypothetical protein
VSDPGDPPPAAPAAPVAPAEPAAPADRPRRPLAVALGLVVLVVVLVAGALGALGLVGAGPFASAGARGAPHFVEETATSGLTHTYGGDEAFDVGGGVAVFDCDEDGRPDVFLAGGGEPSALFRNESPVGGALRFSPVADPAIDGLTSVTGAYPLDIDSDGIVDLAVLRIGVSQLFRGLGDCSFEAADDRWGLAPTSASAMAFSATWEPGATMPTLAFGNYVEIQPNGEFVCPDNEAFRADASGRYGSPIVLSPGYCPLSMLFSDWDGSGRRDLRMSNDRHYYGELEGGEQLWRFDPGRPPHDYDLADGWKLLRLWGMGIASYDLTGDGYPEVYLTSQGANTLQTLADGPSQPTYHDMGLEAGVVATRPAVGSDKLPSTAWHPEFQDVNNDGFMDLFVSKGNVNEVPDYAMQDPNDLFLGQPDGRFTPAAEAAGIVQYDKGRGAALADLNLDGLPDLVVSNLGTPARIWRNVGSGTADAPAGMGHWLGVTLTQDGPNRDAIGAVIETRTGDTIARRELVVGGGHSGGELGWTHLGLGPHGLVDVRVVWPDGEAGPWMTIAADQFVAIVRGGDGPTPWTPPIQ